MSAGAAASLLLLFLERAAICSALPGLKQSAHHSSGALLHCWAEQREHLARLIRAALSGSTPCSSAAGGKASPSRVSSSPPKLTRKQKRGWTEGQQKACRDGGRPVPHSIKGGKPEAKRSVLFRALNERRVQRGCWVQFHNVALEGAQSQQ